MTDPSPPVPMIAVVMTIISSASFGVRGLAAAVEVRDLAGDLGIHSDYSAGVLDGQ
jgi:hypothetical protein